MIKFASWLLGKSVRRRRNHFRTLSGWESLEARKLLATVSLTPLKDNTLYETLAGSVSSGAGNSIAFGLDHQDDLRMRGLIAFDVANSVPAGSTITGVTLTVWNNLTFSNSTPTVELHKLTSDWGEGASAPTRFMPPYGTAKTNDATWNNTFYPNKNWTTPGGDFVSAVSGSVTIGVDNKSYTWNSTSAMVADVQSWVNNPSTNFGWLIKGDETKESGKMIDSKESTTAAHRPTLTVQYTPATSPADLVVAKTHTGTFRQGDAADQYTVTVTNSGAGATNGLVTVTDTLPVGLTASSASGTGWTTQINGSTITATRSDALSGSASYPPLTITVGVSNTAAASVTNSVTVSGGGETNTANDSASDVTSIVAVADLTLTKSHVGNFRQGDTNGNYSLAVRNSGAGPTVGTVTVVDTVPTGLTPLSASGTGWTTSIVGSTVTATRNDVLAGGNSYPILTVTVGVAANAPASVTNSARVSGGGELNTSNDDASDLTLIAGIADLTINKTHSGSFQQGDGSDNYLLTVSNVGAGPTVGQTTVIDTLPNGLIAKAASGTGWTAQINGSTITATRTDVLNNGSSYPTLTVTVGVANDAPNSVTNTATVSGGGESNTANDSSSDVTAIASIADLTITKSHSETFRQGDAHHDFTITVRNQGASTTNGMVTVTDTLPVGLTPNAVAGVGWTTSINGATVTATRSDPLAGSAAYPVLTITASVASNAPASVVNSATVAGGGESNTSNDSASDTVAIVQAADLTLTKTHTGNFEQGSASAAYTIQVANAGAGPTVGTVTISDTLPQGLTPTAASGTGWTTSIVGSVVTATRTDALAASAQYPPLSISVTVASNAATSLTNTATVSGGGELNTANDSASDPTTITIPSSNLAIAKTHSGAFRQGDASDAYSIVVRNIGSLATQGTVTVTDTLPIGLTPSSAVGTGWTANIVGSTITATRSDSLASNGTYPTLTIAVSVENDAPATLTNVAAVSGGGELDTSNDTVSDLTNIVQAADLTISSSHTQSFRQGDTGDLYSVVVRNNGLGPTTGTVTITDTLPTGLTPTLASGTGWTTSIQGNVVTATRSDVLAAGAAYPALSVTVSVGNAAPTSLTNSVLVAGGGELNANNNSATDVTSIVQASDLTITKTHTVVFKQGDVGDAYSIIVSNAPSFGATSGVVTVTDTLPAGLTPTAAAGTGWTTNIVGSTVTATRSDVLAAGASYPSLTVTVTVSNSAPSSLTNTAQVSGGGELNTANDSASDVTAIAATPDLTIAKTHTGTFKQGDTGDSYLIVVNNAGTAPTTGTVTVTDTLPAGLTASTAAGTGWTTSINGSTITATRNDSLAGASSYPALTITVGVANDAPATISNTAQVSGGGESNTANDSSTDPTPIVQIADLTITKTHSGTFRQSDTGDTYSIVVKNSGAGATNGTVTVTDTLPAGLTATAAVGTGWTATISGNVVTATRSDALSGGASYPALTVTVSVANDAPTSVANTATVAGGGELTTSNDSATDTTTIDAASSSLAGFVFLDAGNGGKRINGSQTMHGVAGVTITLMLQDSKGNWNAVSGKSPVQTGADGSYQFTGLVAGTYRIAMTLPKIFLDGQTLVGAVGGAARGTAGTDQITVTLGSGENGTEYDFGIGGMQPTVCSRRWSLASTGTVDQVIQELYGIAGIR